MNKNCKIIILSVLVLSIIIAGYILYNKWADSKLGIVSFKNVLETEIDGRKYIENKEIGLMFGVPNGWETENYNEGTAMHSLDFVPLNENSFFIPQNGCWIEVISEILKNNNDFDPEYGDLKLMINNQDYLNERNNYNKRNLEVVEISGIKGIKSDLLVDDLGNSGNFIYVAIPKENLIYILGTYIFGEDKDVCLQEFNNFLTTVTIKK
ncbi:MAG: hypothetical protein WC938_01955 [Candidatus Paceibacterota bacterium]|jgi:hypothetical protein